MSDMNFASLSPTLLARKGGAKPAMRRQSPMVAGAVPGVQPQQPKIPDAMLEDLGWNDLGENHDSAETAEHTEAEHREESAQPRLAAVANANETDEAGDAQGEDSEARDEQGEPGFASLGRHAESTSNAPEAVTADERPEVAEKITPIRKGAPRLPRPGNAPSMAPAPSQAPEPAIMEHAVSSAKSTGGKRTAFTLRLDPARHLKLRMACTLSNRSAQSLVTEAVDAMFADIPELDQLVARVHARTQTHSSQEG